MMKRLISVVLTLLMLLPTLGMLSFAAPAAAQQTENVANKATITTEWPDSTSVNVTSKVDFSKIVDGDKTTGTHSPEGRVYSLVFTFDQLYYFTEFVIVCNGKGTLADGTSVSSNFYGNKSFTVTVYSNDDVKHTQVYDVSQLLELKIPYNDKADKLVIEIEDGSRNGTEYFWELIANSVSDMELCDVRLHNIADQAQFSFANHNGTHWATDWSQLLDGNRETGTCTPKGRNYSIFMTYPQEYLFSEILLVCNGKGQVKSAGYYETIQFNNPSIQVRLYDYNDNLVWDSELIDTSSMEELIVDPYVKACKIEFMISGTGLRGGSEFLWEVETNIETGNHLFQETEQKNPTCVLPGYFENTCQCGKVVKSVVPPTGFHQWDEGKVTLEPTENANGVFTKDCPTCYDVLEYDVPAIGHNWDNGTVVKPDCDKEGYTLYKCTDPGCDLSYKKRETYTPALGHIWDEGEVTKPTVTAPGALVYSCTRPGCDATISEKIRQHKYSDSTVDFNKTHITKYTATHNEGHKLNLFDGDLNTFWSASAGGSLTLDLDGTYYFVGGKMKIVSNHGTVTVAFQYKEGNEWKDSKVYNTGWFMTQDGDDMNIFDLSGAISEGARAERIVITVLQANNHWQYQGIDGAGNRLLEISFVAHDCSVTEDDYILSGSSYKAPTCTQDGECDAKCPVCGVIQKVKLDNEEYGHKVDPEDIVVDTDATCNTDGVGHGPCSDCGKNITGIKIPATGEHKYDKDIVYMSAKCGFVGIGQIRCEYCDDVKESYPISATGVHTREWSEKSQPSYTAIGRDIYTCIYCGNWDENDPATGTKEIIKDKLVLDPNFLTFKGYSVRTQDFIGFRLSYNFDVTALAAIEETCDIRIITYIENENGEEKSIEVYGKYGTGLYDENGNYSVVVDPRSVYDEFTVRTVVRLMNFRGVEIVECELDELAGNEDGTISVCDVVESVIDSETNSARRELFQQIIDGKN